MTSKLRPLVTLLLLAAVTVGCAGNDEGNSDGSPDGAPAASGASGTAEVDPAVGVYDFTSTITRSTIEQNPAGPQSEESNVIYVTCWDGPCDSVVQRAAADMWHAQTFRLIPDGETYTGTRERTGSCNDGTSKEFRETFTLEWAVAEDGTLAGSAVQEFVGCEDAKVRSAEYEVSGEPRPGDEPPYFESDTAAELAEVLNSYDETFRTVSDGFAACVEDDSDAVGSAQCKADVYEPWAAVLGELGSSLAEFESTATGACSSALERIEVTGSVDALERAVRANREVTNARTARRAEQPDAAGRDITLAMQTDLVQVATMCVPPQDHTALGADGHMLIDSASSLIPPLESNG